MTQLNVHWTRKSSSLFIAFPGAPAVSSGDRLAALDPIPRFAPDTSLLRAEGREGVYRKSSGLSTRTAGL